MTIKTDIPDKLWQLPEYIPKPPRSVDDNGVPAVDTLTPKQKVVYDTLIQYFKGELASTVKMIAVQGYAGTGKTYVITQVLKYFVMLIQEHIGITAPTNKAVKVLRTTANFDHSLITYSTIHKLLGLKPKIDQRTGKQTFESDFDAENEIKKIHSLVIDETSMLPDELYDLVKLETERKTDNVYSPEDLNIVFLGDPIQIPPVGKYDCIPFNEGKSQYDGILTLRLEEIIRQKEGNPILDLATCIRENYKEPYVPYPRVTKITDQGGVIMISASDKPLLYQLCDKYFNSDNFKNDSDFVKVIAWTNAVVDLMNMRIRNMLYPEAVNILTEVPPKIMQGEKLIANSPIMEFEENALGKKKKLSILFNTNDEFEVMEYTIVEEQVFADLKVKCYLTKVKYTDPVSGIDKFHTIPIIHEDYEEPYKAAVENIKTFTLKQPVSMRGEHWRRYYRLKDKFADVKYNYAITAHKSQGSTYENAIVIVSDIDKNKKTEERNRIKYVAFTRAKSHLFIVE